MTSPVLQTERLILRPPVAETDLICHAECHRLSRSVAFVRGELVQPGQSEPVATVYATFMRATAATEAAYNAEAWPLRFHVSLQAFEANGTAPGNALALAATPVVAGAAGGNNWTPALPADLHVPTHLT